MKFSNSKKHISSLINSLKWSCVTLATAFVLQVGFVQGVFAEDSETESGISVEDKAVSPEIEFFLENGVDIVMEFKNIDYNDVSKFLMEGQDIMGTVQSLIDVGTITRTGDKNSFSLKFNFDNPTSLEGLKFGVELFSGTTIVRSLKFINRSSSKGVNFGIGMNVDANRLIDQYFSIERTISYVKGKVCGSGSTWYKCVPVAYGNVQLYIKGNNDWIPMSSGKIGYDGYYYFTGPIGINNKNYCGPVLVKLFVANPATELCLGKNICNQTYDTCTPLSGRTLNINNY